MRGRDQSRVRTNCKVYKHNKPGQGRPLGRVYLWPQVFSVCYLMARIELPECVAPQPGSKNQLGERVILYLESGADCVCSIAHHVSYYIWSDALRPPKSDQARLRLFLLTPLPVAPLESLDISNKETAYESSGESKTKSRRRIDECQLISLIPKQSHQKPLLIHQEMSILINNKQ